MTGELGLLTVALMMVVAMFTATIHGATGIAGGFLLAAFAAPIIGIKAVVPVLSIALLISHAARAWLNFRRFDRSAYLRLILPAIPFIVLTASIYGRLSSAAVAFVLGTVVLSSVPMRRWTAARNIRTSPFALSGAGAVYGAISGLAIGPGMLLMPVLLGLGIGREAFVATLAAVALTTNTVRSAVYGATDLLSAPYLTVALLTGLATIPGNWIGRRILRGMTDERHARAVEFLVVLGGIYFYWLGYQAL